MASPANSYVNQARNVCWLSGVIKRIDATTVLICPSTDVTRGIQVNVRRGLVIPPDNSIVEASCHLYGTHAKDTNTRSIRIDAVYFKRASLAAMPARLAISQTFMGRTNPLASVSEIKESMHKAFARQDLGDEVGDVSELVNAMVRETQKSRVQAKFTNKVILTGFVGAKGVVQASDTEDAYLYVQIHQFPDTERALPVRIYGSIGSFSQHMRTLFPVNLVGELAFVDKPNAEGVLTRQFYVKVTKNEVGSATASDFENRQLPSWWIRAFANHRKQQEANAAASKAGQKPIAAAPVPAPATAAGDDTNPEFADL